MQTFIDGLIGDASGFERELYYLTGMLTFGAVVVFGFILHLSRLRGGALPPHGRCASPPGEGEQRTGFRRTQG